MRSQSQVESSSQSKPEEQGSCFISSFSPKFGDEFPKMYKNLTSKELLLSQESFSSG
jgi:hypothetical protein